jgi:HemY protein
MRGLVWVLALFAAAVGLTLAARYNNGYVLIVVHPWRIELSLNLLVAALAGAFLALYGMVRFFANAIRLPARVREYRSGRARERDREQLLEALLEFFEGRYGRAEQAAAKLLERNVYPALATVIGARAAHEIRAYERRDQYLAQGRRGGGGEVMRLLTEAELLLDERRPVEAIAALEALPDRHSAALRLELRARQMERHWDRVVELVGELERRNVFDREQAHELRRTAISENLRRMGTDVHALRAAWDRLDDRMRRDRRVAAAAARAYLASGERAVATGIIEQALAFEWDADLVRLYAACGGPDALPLVERAEGWLAAHPHDAGLLLTLGQLCLALSLWGKARSYLEASLSIEPGYEPHQLLGELLAQQGDRDGANRHLSAALSAAVARIKPPA